MPGFISDHNSIAVPQIPWFALKVRARSEELTAGTLTQKGYETFVPTFQSRKYYHDRNKLVSSAVFPGYIFCRFEPATRFAVLNTAGVNQIVGFGGAITPIEDDEIENIKRALTGDVKCVPYLTAGQRVQVVKGCLAGLEGILIRQESAFRVVVSIKLLQRSISVSIDAQDINAMPGEVRQPQLCLHQS
jgi:transcriptional antiterminator NusG